MISIPAFTFDELSAQAKLEADKGAVLHASQTLLSSQDNCPAQAVSAMFAMARQEWLGGYFDASGRVRFPPTLTPKVEGVGDTPTPTDPTRN